MREMKDSGIEWIGEIPKTWRFEKGKYHFSNKKIIPGASSYKYQRLALTLKGVIKRDKDDSDGLQPKDFNTYQLLRKDELVFKLIDLQNVSTSRVGLAHETGLVSPAYIILHAKDDIFPKYIEKFYLSMWHREIFNALGDDGVRSSLNSTQLLNVLIPVPSIIEQKKIANFLDKKCSQIDSLRSDIEKQIEILEEYKKSVITEAVTKGLDPDVEMKDIGIEWIGKIPKDWSIIRLKYIFSSNKGLPITKIDLIDYGLPVVSYGQIHAKNNTGTTVDKSLLRYVNNKYQQEYPECEVFQYDFIFADTSEDYDGCGNCVYKRDNKLLFAGYHSIILHSLYQQDNRYLAYLFKTDVWRKQLREMVYGIKVFSVTQKILMNCSVILPSITEQKKIADFLDKKCSQIDSIIASKQQQLESLDNYKKSLIYEYVTGKKEVEKSESV